MGLAIPEGMRTTFRSLGHRNYRLFWAGSLVSNTGTWVQRIAQDWLVLDLTDSSATALGLVSALQFGPSLVLSVLGGAVADRIDRRKILVATNLIGGLLSAVLGWLVISDRVQLWHVLAASGVAGCIWAFDVPSRQSFVSELVGRDYLQNAVALNATSFNLGRLIGPAVSGLLITAYGTGPSFIVNSVSFLFVITSLTLIDPKRLHRPEHEPNPDERLWPRTKAGFAYVKTQRELRGLFVMVAVMGTLGMNFPLWMALMSRLEFGLNADSFGFLGTAMAVGSVTGGILAARRKRTPSLGFVVFLALLFAGVLFISAFAPNYALYAAVLPLCGVANLSVMTTSNATMQLTADPAMRGRVAGIYFMVFTGGTPLGAPLMGFIAEQLGTRVSIGFGAVSVCVTALALKRWLGSSGQASGRMPLPSTS